MSFAPEVYTVLPKIMFDSSRIAFTRLLFNNLQGRWQSATTSLTGAEPESVNAYFCPFGDIGFQSAPGDSYGGYHSYEVGFNTGVEKQLDAVTTAGWNLTGQYNDINLSGKSDANARDYTTRQVVYLGTLLQDRIDLDTAVGHSFNYSDTRRMGMQGGLSGKNHGDFDSQEVSAMLNIGCRFYIADHWIMEPMFGAYASYLHGRTVFENGTAARRLRLKSANYYSVQSLLGVRFQYQWDTGVGLRLVPEFYGFWCHQYADRSFRREVSFDDGLSYQRWEGRTFSRDHAQFGVRLTTEISANTYLSIDFETAFGGGYYDNNFGLSIGYSF